MSLVIDMERERLIRYVKRRMEKRGGGWVCWFCLLEWARLGEE